MSVPFEEAIASLQSMFSTFDRDIITMVLQQNKGHMEKTIDSLLEMSGESPINQNTDSDLKLAQMEQDEVLARMLQNDLFINEIKKDEEFAILFQNRERQLLQQRLQRQQQQRQLQQQQQERQQRKHSSNDLYHYDDDDDVDPDEDGVSPLSVFEEDFGEFKEKLNQLGEAAKNKFKELSDYFMKKEESGRRYDPVNTKNEDLEHDSSDRAPKTIVNRNVSNSNHNFSINGEEEVEEEVVVFDRNGSRKLNNSGNNLRTSVNSNNDDANFDTFVLDNGIDRNRNGLKLRTFANKKDD